jgi:hypothetical protein
VADVTSDGSRRSWRSVLGELVLAVMARTGDRVIAFARAAGAGGSAPVQTWVYASRDGGRRRRYDGKLGAT